MDSKVLKQTLGEGGIAIGTWVFEFNTPGIARLLSSAGADFVVYDMEHSGFGTETIRNLVSHSRAVDLAVLVRPPAGEYHLIAPLLDLGANGVIVPKVETATEAARVVDSCRYPPQGHRGAAFAIAHDDFRSGDVAAKMKTANDSMICCMLIETVTGVENIDAILNVSGVDLIWVGFLDLSLSMRIPGQYAHPDFKAALSRVVSVCQAHGTPAGILADRPQSALDWIKQGFHCISYSGDLWLLQRALSEGIQAIRQGLAEGHTKNVTA